MTSQQSPYSPEQLFAQAASGDKQAFGAFYQLYLDEIYRYIYFHVFDHQLAEDLTETTFLKAWKTLTAGKKKTKIKNMRAWIYRIAHNTVVDHHRTAKDEVAIDAVLHTRSGSTPLETLVEDRQQAAQLYGYITRLDPQYRQVIVLRFLNHMSHAETAQAMGIKEGHVRVLQYRALKQLHSLMAAESEET